MKLLDLSQPLYDGAPNCPAHPPVRSTIIADHPKDGWRVELLTLASHTGSHVDAPYHKLAHGAKLDDIPLERFTGLAVIADFRDARPDQPIKASLGATFDMNRKGTVTSQLTLNPSNPQWQPV